jgi:hypothetical protein
MAATHSAVVMVVPSVVSVIVARVVSSMVVAGSAGERGCNRDCRDRSSEGRET